MRSEAAVAILLQRASDSRRVYANVVHARANTDGNKGEGVTFPSGAVQRQLLEEVYQHAGVSPLDVSYIEAHGTGTKVSSVSYLLLTLMVMDGIASANTIYNIAIPIMKLRC